MTKLTYINNTVRQKIIKEPLTQRLKWKVVSHTCPKCNEKLKKEYKLLLVDEFKNLWDRQTHFICQKCNIVYDGNTQGLYRLHN